MHRMYYRRDPNYPFVAHLHTRVHVSLQRGSMVWLALGIGAGSIVQASLADRTRMQ